MAQTLPSDTFNTSVLIVGAGPTGLSSALLLLRYGITDITIIDKSPIRVQIGHAAGLQPRSQEITHTLGLKSKFDTNSGGLAETAFWSAKDDKAPIERSFVASEVKHPSPYQSVEFQHQGRVEEIFAKEIEQLGCRVKRPCEFLEYDYTEGKDYPVCAYVRDHVRGSIQQYHCRYLIGADGANSVVRSVSSAKMATNEPSDSWVVVDGAVRTDFPDYRRRSAIRTPRGNVMVIPGPRDTVRLYMLLSHDEDLQDLAASKFDDLPAHLFDQKKGRTTTTPLDIYKRRLPSIFAPYEMEITRIDWISKYVVAQKVIESFTAHDQHVLFLGDSAHSHSPKAGQGMNTGMQDAYNLAWKLALVLKKRASSSLLQTYDTERRHIANQLIEFDTKFAKLFGAQSSFESDEFEKTWKEAQGFTSELKQEYPQNPLVVPSSNNIEAESALIPGQRLAPMTLTRHLDGWSVNSLDTMPALGAFYEVIFAGDISREPRRSEFRKLYSFLTSPGSVLSKYNGQPPNKQGWAPEDVFSSPPLPLTEVPNKKVMNLYVVHTANHLEIELRPDFELWKWNFFEDKGGIEHERHGVDPNGPIRVAVVRPDHIVGLVRDGDENLGKEVHKYFEGFMVQS